MVSEIEVAVRLLQEVQKVAKKLHLVASVMLSHTSYIICLLRYNMHVVPKKQNHMTENVFVVLQLA